MKRLSALLLTASWWLSPSPAALAQPAPSPYQTRFVVDAPLTVGLASLGVAGLYLVQHKHLATAADLAALHRTNVPVIDRFSVGTYSESAQASSDVFCYGTLALLPAVLAFNPLVHGRYGQVAGLYLETMATTAAIFSLTVGTVSRAQPYLYGSQGGSKRQGALATNSFLGATPPILPRPLFSRRKSFTTSTPTHEPSPTCGERQRPCQS
jgi:hypothetical protein